VFGSHSDQVEKQERLFNVL